MYRRIEDFENSVKRNAVIALSNWPDKPDPLRKLRLPFSPPLRLGNRISAKPTKISGFFLKLSAETFSPNTRLSDLKAELVTAVTSLSETAGHRIG